MAEESNVQFSDREALRYHAEGRPGKQVGARRRI